VALHFDCKMPSVFLCISAGVGNKNVKATQQPTEPGTRGRPFRYNIGQVTWLLGDTFVCEAGDEAAGRGASPVGDADG
jgi:hypothetical protein